MTSPSLNIQAMLGTTTAAISAASTVSEVYNAWGNRSAAINGVRTEVVTFLVLAASPEQKTAAVDELIVAEAEIVGAVYDALNRADQTSAKAFLDSFRTNTAYLLTQLEIAARSSNPTIKTNAERIYAKLSLTPLSRSSRSSSSAPEFASPSILSSTGGQSPMEGQSSLPAADIKVPSELATPTTNPFILAASKEQLEGYLDDIDLLDLRERNPDDANYMNVLRTMADRKYLRTLQQERTRGGDLSDEAIEEMRRNTNPFVYGLGSCIETSVIAHGIVEF